MNLWLLLLLPLVTGIAIAVVPGERSSRFISLYGAIIQLVLAGVLTFSYWNLKAAGNKEDFLFQSNISWYSSWNIGLHFGVDGISIAMILLTAFVVLAAVLLSWNIDTMRKEFFFLLILLSAGAYGFFISLDLFIG